MSNSTSYSNPITILPSSTYNGPVLSGQSSFGNIQLPTIGGISAIGTNYSFTGTTGVINPNPNSLQVSGNVKIEGDGADIVIGSLAVRQTLEKLIQNLPYLIPNPEIETEWEELKELGQRYRELEAEIKEKLRVWEILKKEQND